MTRPPRELWLRYAIWVAVLGFLLWAVWPRLAAVATILLAAAVICYVLKPGVDFICRPRLRGFSLPRLWGTLIMCAIVVGALWLLGGLLLPPVGQEIADLQQRWPAQRARLLELWQGFEQARANIPPQFRPSLDRALEDAAGRVTAYLANLPGQAWEAVARSITIVVELVLALVLALYFLSDAATVKEQVLYLVPSRSREAVARVLAGFDDIFNRYVKGQVILCFIAFVVVSAGLWALGIRFFLLLGIIAGLTRAIPIVGPLVGGVPLAVSILAQGRSAGFTAWVIAAFALLHLLESKYLMPKVLGLSLGLHPVLILVALAVGAQFFGLLGMFLSVPALAAVFFLVRQGRQQQAEGSASASVPAGQPEL